MYFDTPFLVDSTDNEQDNALPVPLLGRLYWAASTGPPLLGHLYWAASTGPPLLGHLYWATSTGPPLLGHLYWAASTTCVYMYGEL